MHTSYQGACLVIVALLSPGCLSGDDVPSVEGPFTLDLVKADEDDALIVRAAGDEATWGMVGLRADHEGLRVDFRDQAKSYSQLMGRSYERLEDAGSGPIMVDDSVHFCSHGAHATDVVIDVANLLTNDRLGSFRFSTISKC